MKLVEILSEETIKVPLQTVDKKEIIEELVASLSESGRINDKGNVLEAILDREAVMSTGVGDGVAIPHGKSDSAPSIVAALGVTREPVDFDSIDNKPVRLVWLLVGPPGNTGPHLKALSRISRLMHKSEFREKLLHVESAGAVLNELREQENAYFE